VRETLLSPLKNSSKNTLMIDMVKVIYIYIREEAFLFIYVINSEYEKCKNMLIKEMNVPEEAFLN
jgi:hypothetical protein